MPPGWDGAVFVRLRLGLQSCMTARSCFSSALMTAAGMLAALLVASAAVGSFTTRAAARRKDESYMDADERANSTNVSALARLAR